MSYLSLWQRKGTPIKRMLFDLLTGDAVETLYERTIINNPASFTTEVAKPLKGLSIPFTSESGLTGLNIYRTGENMLPATNMNPNVYNVSADGTVSNKSTSQGYGWTNYGYRVFDAYLPAGTYTLVVVEVEEPTTTGSGATVCDENGGWIKDLSGKTGTTRKASFTLSVGKRVGVVTKCMDGAYKIAIVPGSSGEYATYSGTTIPISWQTEAGAVNEGELDALTGVLTVTSPENKTVQLDPVTLSTLIGENVIWTDTNSDNTIVYLSKTQGVGLGGGFGGRFGGGFGGGSDEPDELEDLDNQEEPQESDNTEELTEPTKPEEPVTDE